MANEVRREHALAIRELLAEGRRHRIPIVAGITDPGRGNGDSAQRVQRS